MQIAGNKCRVCGLNIVLSSEGDYCLHCSTFVHSSCEPRGVCNVCGNRLEQYEPPQADLIAQAVLPRSLRPAGTGGPALAVGMIFLFAVLIVLFYSCIASGH
jgi:hypothetical protein